jgi:hypothetical protein
LITLKEIIATKESIIKKAEAEASIEQADPEEQTEENQ